MSRTDFIANKHFEENITISFDLPWMWPRVLYVEKHSSSIGKTLDIFSIHHHTTYLVVPCPTDSEGNSCGSQELADIMAEFNDSVSLVLLFLVRIKKV